MDNVAMRLANGLVANPSGAPALEVSYKGPTLHFKGDPVKIAVCGAKFDTRLNGSRLPSWRAVTVRDGDVLAIGGVDQQTPGCRTYLAISGGFAAPKYMGSVSVFQGQYGGFTGKGEILQPDMVLHNNKPSPVRKAKVLSPLWIPKYTRSWVIGVVPGPQEAPDYLTAEDVEAFYDATWKVSQSSSRLGVRLAGGPRFQWARPDGGGGGTHPSNLHDNPYGIGAINFTGDHPVILCQDGPSLGGFICPAVVPQCELSKVGQLKPGDTVNFRRIGQKEAAACQESVNFFVENFFPSGEREQQPITSPDLNAVAFHRAAQPSRPKAQYRVVGDRYLLIEFGEPDLDINLRIRIHCLDQRLASRQVPGVIDRIPGVRSLLIEYDGSVLPLTTLMSVVQDIDDSITEQDTLKPLPSRVWKLPLAFRDRWNLEAIERYSREVRQEAAYLPDNIDFIANNNGLSNAEEVRSIVFSASYLCLGLGDVYLGAPCAVAVDPRHRLTVPKYNPARSYTPEGAVGFGGTYLCIYPMTSPGGYQLFGRTIPIWRPNADLKNFQPSKPWLLEIFDQIQFYEVSDAELESIRDKFSAGKHVLDCTESQFDPVHYNKLVESLKDTATVIANRQKIASAKMLELDRLLQAKTAVQDEADTVEEGVQFADGSKGQIGSPLPGTVVRFLAKDGELVQEGEQLLVLNSMKMETVVRSTTAGIVRFTCHPKQTVEGMQLLARIG